MPRTDTQSLLGDALAEQGIKVSFGDPVHVGGYPTVKLDWYSTRRVNRWSGVVRQEKSAQHYQALGGVPETRASEENGTSAGAAGEPENKRKSKHYEDKVVKSNTSFDSEAVANAIRQRRVEEGKKSPKPSREEIRKVTNDKAAQAVQARMNN